MKSHKPKGQHHLRHEQIFPCRSCCVCLMCNGATCCITEILFLISSLFKLWWPWQQTKKEQVAHFQLWFKNQDSTQFSVESVPGLWPHVGEIAAATKTAAPADITSIVGPSIPKRGACRCPSWTHFSQEKDTLKKKSYPEKRFVVTERLMQAKREQSQNIKTPNLKRKQNIWQINCKSSVFGSVQY